MVISCCLYAVASSAENRIPFVYLNQYYPFSIKNDHEIKLSSTQVNFEQFKVSSDQKTISVDLSALRILPAVVKAYLTLKDLTGVSLGTRTDLVAKKLVYSLANRDGADEICLVQSSNFTTLELCKKIYSKTLPTSEFLAKVVIDGTEFENSGAVVLKDSAKPVVFEASLSAMNKLWLTTRKRKIFPRKVTKLEDQEFVSVQFVDLDLVKNNSWNEKIMLEQTAFNILLDPLLITVQDIYFSNENLKSGSLNYVYSDPKKNRNSIIFTNETTAEFFGIYTGLNGSAAAIKAQLNSELGKGVMLSHQWQWRSSVDLLARATFIQTVIALDSVHAVYNAGQNLFSVAAGGKYHLTEATSIAAEVELKKDLYFRRHDLATGAVDVISGLNKEVNILPVWSFFKSENSTARVTGIFSYLLPTLADGDAITAGTAYGTELSYSYRINSNQFRLRAGYLKRQQNSEAFNFSEQTALYGFGYQYLF